MVCLLLTDIIKKTGINPEGMLFQMINAESILTTTWL